MKKGKSSVSWYEKLHKEMQPKIVEVPEKWAMKIGQGRLLVPTPLLVDEAIRKIPKGKLATVNGLRDYLADSFRADMTCPLTTGIFLNISAHAAEEEKQKGKVRVTPWWRVLKEGGHLNPKFPGGTDIQRKLLQKEGYRVVKGKTAGQWLVDAYQQQLINF